jgi:excisionase family DNA binding protein
MGELILRPETVGSPLLPTIVVQIQPTITLTIGQGSSGFKLVPVDQPEPDVLDLRAASKYLDMTSRKLKDLCRDKRITHSRPDYRTYRFMRSDLDAWLSEYRVHRR